MPKTVQFSHTSGGGTPERTIVAEFEEAEWSLLLSFRQYSRELADTELMKVGGPGQFKVSYKQGEGISFSVTLPPNDRVLAFIHRLRPFILQGEPTHFNKVCNLLARRIPDEQFRKLLDLIRNHYCADQMRPVIITADNVTINSEETLIKWLNAFEYHRDTEKREEIEALHKVMPLEASRALFVMSLYDKASAIMTLSEIVAVVTGEQSTYSWA